MCNGYARVDTRVRRTGVPGYLYQGVSLSLGFLRVVLVSPHVSTLHVVNHGAKVQLKVAGADHAI